MLELNPEIVDQDKIRKQKRKRMLKIAFLPCLLLVLAGGFFLRTTAFNVIYDLSYENKNYDTTELITEMQKVGNIVTPYITFFDSGVTKLVKTDYSGAEAEFRSALKENPPKNMLCKIYVNLSLSIELQADTLVKKQKYDDALVLYNTAQSTLYENNCANKQDGNGSDKKAEAANTRLDSKRSRAVAYMNSIDDSGNDEESGNSGVKPATNDQLEEIRSQQPTEAALDAIRESMGGKGANFSGNNTKKPW